MALLNKRIAADEPYVTQSSALQTLARDIVETVKADATFKPDQTDIFGEVITDELHRLQTKARLQTIAAAIARLADAI